MFFFEHDDDDDDELQHCLATHLPEELYQDIKLKGLTEEPDKLFIAQGLDGKDRFVRLILSRHAPRDTHPACVELSYISCDAEHVCTTWRFWFNARQLYATVKPGSEGVKIGQFTAELALTSPETLDQFTVIQVATIQDMISVLDPMGVSFEPPHGS